MHPWSCDDIVTCDNFEYMVRPSAEALLFLAVTADAVFIAKSSPPTDTPAPADPVLFPRAPQETATFATTGGHVWPAARRLLEYFEAVADDIGLSRPGAQIVELGAGTGWLSVALAKNLPNAERVVATEMRAGGALRWLRRNVRANERIDATAPTSRNARCWHLISCLRIRYEVRRRISSRGLTSESWKITRLAARRFSRRESTRGFTRRLCS